MCAPAGRTGVERTGPACGEPDQARDGCAPAVAELGRPPASRCRDTAGPAPRGPRRGDHRSTPRRAAPRPGRRTCPGDIVRLPGPHQPADTARRPRARPRRGRRRRRRPRPGHAGRPCRTRTEPVLAPLALPPLPSGGLTVDNWAAVIGALLPQDAVVCDESITAGMGTLHAATACSPPHDPETDRPVDRSGAAVSHRGRDRLPRPSRRLRPGRRQRHVHPVRAVEPRPGTARHHDRDPQPQVLRDPARRTGTRRRSQTRPASCSTRPARTWTSSPSPTAWVCPPPAPGPPKNWPGSSGAPFRTRPPPHRGHAACAQQLIASRPAGGGAPAQGDRDPHRTAPHRTRTRNPCCGPHPARAPARSLLELRAGD